MNSNKSKSVKPVWLLAIIFGVAAVVIVFLYYSNFEKSTVSQTKVEKIAPENLVGSWLRPDGGYVLEIKNAREDGTLQVAYFNPKPINVAVSNWRWTGSNIEIYVEFHDVNYYGSNYKLEYYPAADQLIGNYFQATMEQNFQVVFVRNKE